MLCTYLNFYDLVNRCQYRRSESSNKKWSADSEKSVVVVNHHSNNSYALNRQLSVDVKSAQYLSVYLTDDEENFLFHDGQRRVDDFKMANYTLGVLDDKQWQLGLINRSGLNPCTNREARGDIHEYPMHAYGWH